MRRTALWTLALLAGLAISGGPAGAAGGEGSDAGEAAKAEITKIKVIVGRSRNALGGSIYSHNSGCVGGRRVRVFAVTGGRSRLLDTRRSVRGGSIGYFGVKIGRFKWNQTYRLVTAPRRVGRLRCEGDRQTYREDCRRDAVLDLGRPTTNCYPLPTGPAALEGTVTSSYTSDGLTQVWTGAVRLTRIAKPGDGNVQGGLHEATLAYQTAPGRLNWTVSGTHTTNHCTYDGSGEVTVGSERPSTGLPPPDTFWARLVFELGTREFGPGRRYTVESEAYAYGYPTYTCNGTPRPAVISLFPGWFDFAGSLYSNGSEFVPGVHTESVRDDGTLAGVHSLAGEEVSGNSGSTARVEWSLHQAQ
jgi:hypothetical protein